MTCCDIKKLYTRLLQPSQPLNASVLLSWNKSWEWAQHFRRLRWHVPAVEGRRWGVMRGNVCPLVKDVQWQNSWHHSETLRGRGVHVQLDQKHQAEAQSQEMDWIVQHLEVTLYMSKRTNHARSAVKCFRVLSLEHLKAAVTCHATPQGRFQRTGKYRNIEQSRDEGGDSGTTNMSAKEESIQRRHILLSHTFKVDRLIRSQPLSFDVTKHDIWLNNRVRRWWLFLYHMSKVKSRYPVYSVCILKLPLSTFTVLRHKKDKK